MKTRKKLIWIASVLTLLLVLTGCTANQQAIFDASMKMQEVHSMQEHVTLSFALSGSGLEPKIQEQVDSAAAMLNAAKLELDVKTSGNEQKTVVKSQVDMNVTAQGLTINMPYWVDMDLAGSTPKFMEIFKLPVQAKASLPPQFAGKEYAVMNPNDMNKDGLNTIDMSKLMKFSTSFQAKEVDFLTRYAQRFNPNIDVVKVPTNDGPGTAQKYTVKLNDAQLKELISYTVNNFAQDKEAMNFMKEYFNAVLELSQAPNRPEASGGLEQGLDKMNAILEQLKNVTLLGDKGLELSYTISDGYLIQNSGMLDLHINMSDIKQLMNIPSSGEEAVNANGSLNLKINFNTNTTGINLPVEIQIPEVNSDNSFNYFDLIEASIPHVEPVLAESPPPVNNTYTVVAGDTLGTIALNHYGNYGNFSEIYKANLDAFKKSNNHLDAGMVLILPTEGLLAPLSTENVKQVYTVKAGDTLGEIAKQMYGDSPQYMKIFEANKGRLVNPNMIYEGQKIIIPN